MKVTFACLLGPRKIELRQKELEPREDQVLVRMIACGICRGDVRLFEHGQAPAEPFGHEPVGQVVARGPWVRELSEGDCVVGAIVGAFASHGVGRESQLYRVPAELGEAACLAEPLKCVTTVARAASPDFGDTVVVMGCGFMGLSVIAALQGGWQKALVAVDPVPERRSLAVSFGASHVLDPQKDDVQERICDVTHGRGADVAIEFTGNPEVPALAGRLLRPRGKLVLGGGYGPRENLYSSATTVHHVPPAFSPDEGDDYRRAIEAMVRERFPLPQLVSHRFKLSEIQRGFETASRGGSDYIKGIVLADNLESLEADTASLDS